MPVSHGKNAKLYVNGWDLSKWFTKVGAAGKADVAEVSTLGTSDKQYLSGMQEGTISGDGFYDEGPATAASVFGSAFLVDTSVLTVTPQGDAFGAKMVGMETALTDFTIDTDTGNAGAITLAAQSKVGIDSGVVLHPLGAEVAGSISAMIDNGVAPASPTNGGLDSYLHVTAAAGGTLTVKVQHSVDNITYVDLCVHTAVTLPHKSELVHSLALVPSGLVNRYLKCLWTLTGTATFFCGATRLTRTH